MTSRELTSGFDFWSHVISAWSWCIFSSNLEQIPLSNPELLTMDFQVMLIWLFWRADSVVFVLCGKFGSNTRSSQWDRRTCASDVHLMTSRELTSGFDFWKCGHLRMASMHIPIKNGADILIQSRVIDIFRNSIWRPPPSWIFRLCKFNHSSVLTVWYLSSVHNLVQISVIVTEIDALVLQTFIWWRHAN